MIPGRSRVRLAGKHVLLACLSVTCASVSAASLSFDHDVPMAAVVQRQHLPIWAFGRMVRIQNNSTAAPVFSSFNELGKLVADTTFTLPDANQITVSGFSLGADGTLVLGGWSSDAAGRLAGFFATVSPSSAVRVVRTNPYFPGNVALASDGTIWTVGEALIGGRETDTSYDVLRQYSADGALLRSAIPRSSITQTEIGEHGHIAAALGRIGWYTGPLNGSGSEYVEVRKDGTLLRVAGRGLANHESVTGYALTDSGAFVSTENHDTNSTAVYSLDGSGNWQPVTLPAVKGRVGWLYGGDGNRLVAPGDDTNTVRFFRTTK